MRNYMLQCHSSGTGEDEVFGIKHYSPVVVYLIPEFPQRKLLKMIVDSLPVKNLILMNIACTGMRLPFRDNISDSTCPKLVGVNKI